jgi:GxxExxY protein
MMDPELLVDDEMQPDPRLNEVTNAILGAAFEVHTELGPGYQEEIYANALEIEFKRRGIQFRRECRFDVLYKGEQVGRGRIDFIVEESVLVELKAVETLTPVFTAQVISYLKATKLRLALIINFNVRRLKDGIKRVAK